MAAALAATVGASLASALACAQEPGQELAQQSGEPSSQQSSREATQNCPGHPNALGTGRVLAIDPAEFTRVGGMQYPESLPLAGREVVLTFDDGPLPPYSNQILDILAAECVKATYFLVGSMAHAYPAVVRRIFQEGHTIGTHSENHPLNFGRLPLDKMRHEIDAGIADVSAALGDANALAPFFRIPGLDRSDALESELAARSLVVFSSDTVADDWHHRIKANQIIALALNRIEARGKGILLLHDIHPITVAALPGILKELKDKGFRVVQVVPAASPQIAIANRPTTWMLASAMPEQLSSEGAVARPTWPQAAEELAHDDIALPAPDAAAFEPDAGLALERGEVRWPDQPKAIAALSVPQKPAAAGKKLAASNKKPAASSKKLAASKRITVASNRRNHDVTGSIDRKRVHADRSHGHRHARAKPAADGHHAAAFSGIKAFAAVSTPAAAP